MPEMITESDVSYSQLQEIEEDTEDVELEILRQQAKLMTDIYARRAKLTAKIPNFWPLVLEQAPPDIDEYVQPTDAALLNSALLDISLERFELATPSGGGGGDPRSVSVRMTFADNDYFAAQTLEKKFWWRYAPDGWSGLVSEPVRIAWKSKDKDLTGGLLDLVCRLREEEVRTAGGKRLAGDREEKKRLMERMDRVGMGGVSFFAFFGFVGRRISAEESEVARRAEEVKRRERKAGKDVEEEEEEDGEDGEDDGLEDYDAEIFPMADDVVVCLLEDIWPNAIKYFITSQQDDLSDMDFEDSDDEEEDEEMGEANGDEKGSKKRKA